MTVHIIIIMRNIIVYNYISITTPKPNQFNQYQLAPKHLYHYYYIVPIALGHNHHDSRLITAPCMEQVYAINWFIELNHTNGSHDE